MGFANILVTRKTNVMREELLKGLSEEQIQRVKACKDSSELLSIAKEEDIDLTDEQLEAINGGCGSCERKCPACGSTEYETRPIKGTMVGCDGGTSYRCKKCHHVWSEI